MRTGQSELANRRIPEVCLIAVDAPSLLCVSDASSSKQCSLLQKHLGAQREMASVRNPVLKLVPNSLFDYLQRVGILKTA